MFWSQLKKELMSHRGEAMLLTGIILLWDVFLHTRIGLWDPWLVFPLGFAPPHFCPHVDRLDERPPLSAGMAQKHPLPDALLAGPGVVYHLAQTGGPRHRCAGIHGRHRCGEPYAAFIGRRAPLEIKAFWDALPDDWLIVTAVQMGGLRSWESVSLG